jgi:UDP-N-acetylmuramate dehydrogenase
MPSEFTKRNFADFSTISLGGPCTYIRQVGSIAELEDAYSWAARSQIPWFCFGGGSNILMSDAGFPGLGIKLELRGIQYHPGDLVEVACGENWDYFVLNMISEGRTGIECLSGIPGTVGATPIQNVGAYGQDVSQTIESVTLMNFPSMSLKTLTNSECQFFYRDSIFKSTKRNEFVITSVTFKLPKAMPAAPSYKELVSHLEKEDHYKNAQTPTEKMDAIRNTVIRLRRSKGMVLDPNDPDSKSLGSFFKNTIIDKAQLDFAKNVDNTTPYFEAGEGLYKIPAAWLIERSGFKKGYRQGNVQLSSKHTLALVNHGSATTKELLALASNIQKKVYELYKIHLEMEPERYGV